MARTLPGAHLPTMSRPMRRGVHDVATRTTTGGGSVSVRALSVVPGKPETAGVSEPPDPSSSEGALLVQGLLVGVCGTDLEIINEGYGWPPPGQDRRVLGHESLGQVIDAPADSGFAAGDLIAGIGALKMLDNVTGEVKSMRTHPAFLRMGAAAVILERIIETARSRGAKQLSLETGSGPAFEPALALYRRRGFVHGEAFSDYERNAFSQFLHLNL